jgi:hypothetical protein
MDLVMALTLFRFVACLLAVILLAAMLGGCKSTPLPELLQRQSQLGRSQYVQTGSGSHKAKLYGWDRIYFHHRVSSGRRH